MTVTLPRRGLLAAGVALPFAAAVVPASPARAAVPAGVVTTLRSLRTPRPGAYGTVSANWSDADVLHLHPAGAGVVGVATVDTEAGRLVVDRYDLATGAATGSATTIGFDDFPIFGGVHTTAGGEHVLLLGRPNPDEDDQLTVIAVRRYDADWRLLGTAFLRGGASQGTRGIETPFDASAADVHLVGSRLVVHSGRAMYADGGGTHHQGNMTFEVDLATMTAATFESLGEAPYSSHSFRQLVTRVGDHLVFLDHGDAFERGLVMTTVAGYPARREAVETTVFPFRGDIGDNHTGARLTGAAGGPSRALVVGVSQPHDQAVGGVRGFAEGWRQNVFALSADPVTGQTTFRWLTEFDPRGATGAEEPRLTQLAADRFALLFTVRTPSGTRQEYRLVSSGGAVLASAAWEESYFSPTSDPVLIGSRLLWAGIDDPADGLPEPTPSYLFGLDVTDPAAPVRIGSGEVVLSTDTALRRLRLEGSKLSSRFSPGTLSYTAVARADFVNVQGYVRHPGATLEYRPSGRASWSPDTVPLYLPRGGRGRIEVRVTAEDGVTRSVYRVAFTRPRR